MKAKSICFTSLIAMVVICIPLVGWSNTTEQDLDNKSPILGSWIYNGIKWEFSEDTLVTYFLQGSSWIKDSVFSYTWTDDTIITSYNEVKSTYSYFLGPDTLPVSINGQTVTFVRLAN